ncbi:MAG: tRNA adenosine(34) deaminase TadA [Defluviitaleaceae bacterium]|nr:tRNA adenosine(34) deaminase TadA [Defluviitaleaceae bacterium]
MKQAMVLAQKAADKDEVPVGCVIVHDGRVIGEGYNLRNTKGNTLYHAEMIAINRACQILGDWRLDDCTMYVTLEPCPMCAGAILQARLPRLIFGAENPKAGAAGSVVNLLNNTDFNHTVCITQGILEQECAAMIKDFFKKRR